jgi:hypothetical protein
VARSSTFDNANEFARTLVELHKLVYSDAEMSDEWHKKDALEWLGQITPQTFAIVAAILAMGNEICSELHFGLDQVQGRLC